MANARGLSVLVLLNCDRALGLGAVALALAIATYFGIPGPR
jgi:hypothetical protein